MAIQVFDREFDDAIECSLALSRPLPSMTKCLAVVWVQAGRQAFYRLVVGGNLGTPDACGSRLWFTLPVEQPPPVQYPFIRLRADKTVSGRCGAGAQGHSGSFVRRLVLLLGGRPVGNRAKPTLRRGPCFGHESVPDRWKRGLEKSLAGGFVPFGDI